MNDSVFCITVSSIEPVCFRAHLDWDADISTLVGYEKITVVECKPSISPFFHFSQPHDWV